MPAKYIIATLACVFVIAGILARPQSRAWLLVGGIFAAVSLWLFSRA